MIPFKRSAISNLGIIALAIIGGAISGIAYNIINARDPKEISPQIINGWRRYRQIGNKEVSPQLRAWIAKVGIFALPPSEVLYFDRNTDSAGNPLIENCNYRIDVFGLPSRWWSVTVYAENGFLPKNQDQHLSFTSQNGSAGASLLLSRQDPRKEGWVSTHKAGNFQVFLRAYQPIPGSAEDLAQWNLPHIIRLGCDAE